MSDVKAFTGFIAVDGTTHSSMKAAVDHSRTVKIKNALQASFGGQSVVTDENPDTPWLALDAFIYDNRDVIIAALNQEVLTRKKRTPNKPKVEGAKPKVEGAKTEAVVAAAAVAAGAIAAATVTPSVGVQGVENLDDMLAGLGL